MLQKKNRNLVVSGILFFLFLICGCEAKDYTLHFNEEMVLDYRSNDSPLTLIDKIGNEKVTKDMIKKNKIELDNFTVECDAISTDNIGTYEIKYVTNDTEDRYHTKSVKIADISAPVIKLKEKNLTMTLEEYKLFDFSTIITVHDNWEKDEPIVQFMTDEITGEGIYTVVVYAEDIAGNKSKKEFKVTIKEKLEEIEETIPNPPSEKENVPAPYPQTLPSPEAPPISSPVNRDFLFSDGYTMDNVGSACHSALSGHSGECTPIKDENGIYVGMRLTFY